MQKGSRTQRFDKFSSYPYCKIEKVCSGENTKDVAKHLSDKEIGLCVHHGFHQQPQQENCQSELRRKDMGKMKGDQTVGLPKFLKMEHPRTI